MKLAFSLLLVSLVCLSEAKPFFDKGNGQQQQSGGGSAAGGLDISSILSPIIGIKTKIIQQKQKKINGIFDALTGLVGMKSNLFSGFGNKQGGGSFSGSQSSAGSWSGSQSSGHQSSRPVETTYVVLAPANPQPEFRPQPQQSFSHAQSNSFAVQQPHQQIPHESYGVPAQQQQTFVVEQQHVVPVQSYSDSSSQGHAEQHHFAPQLPQQLPEAPGYLPPLEPQHQHSNTCVHEGGPY